MTLTTSSLKKPRIAIIGSGIAGLTVAHECAEQGCEVTIFEKDVIIGGKAATDYYQFVPRDHALKNIGAYYYCFLEQLKRISYNNNKSVFDLLTPIKSISIRYEQHTVEVSTGLSARDRLQRVIQLYRFFRLFLSRKDLFRLANQLVKFIFSSDKKREQLDSISYIDLLQLDDEHPLIKISEAIAAIDPRSSARMCLDQFFRQILGVVNPHHLKYMTHFLSMPATESLLSPWKTYLKELGVKFVCDTEITSLNFSEHNNNVISINSQEKTFSGFDVFVIATDIPNLRRLNSLHHFNDSIIFSESCEKKACGFFIALSKFPDQYKPKQYYFSIEHPWSIIFLILTPETFPNMQFPDGCEAYFWISFSNVTRLGQYLGKNLENASCEEVLFEVTHYLNFTDQDRQHILDSFWGRQVKMTVDHTNLDSESKATYKNIMPTLFNRSVNPKLISNKTQYNNLFLAGEFTDTLQKSPTMEKANESGKRCSYLILTQWKIDYPIHKFHYQYLPWQKAEF